MRRLTRKQQREIAAIAAKRDEEIERSEMPEVIDWSGAGCPTHSGSWNEWESRSSRPLIRSGANVVVPTHSNLANEWGNRRGAGMLDQIVATVSDRLVRSFPRAGVLECRTKPVGGGEWAGWCSG